MHIIIVTDIRAFYFSLFASLEWKIGESEGELGKKSYKRGPQNAHTDNSTSFKVQIIMVRFSIFVIFAASIILSSSVHATAEGESQDAVQDEASIFDRLRTYE